MWDSILSEIRNQVTPSVYNTWFTGTTGRILAGTWTIETPNAQAATELTNRYSSLIGTAIRHLTGTEMPIQIRHRRKP